jgi:acyl-CoA thioester hydrolase
MRRLVPEHLSRSAELPFVLQGRARFHETDAMGVVHHASYLRYLEDGRVEYLRALGQPYDAIRAGGVDFAVVGVHLAYHAPLRFDDGFTIGLGLIEARRASFRVQYVVERDDGLRVLSGTTSHAVLDAATGRPRRVPAWLSEAATILPR